MEQNKPIAGGYFTELSCCLTREGFTVREAKESMLPVEWNGQSLCRVNGDGVIRYDGHVTSDPVLDDALSRAIELTRMVTEYMTLMERAPDLTATGLESGFKLLGEFNDTVLAGNQTRYGVNFVTWKRDRNCDGLYDGHYFMEDYAGARQDFAVRAGLVQRERIFTSEQITEAYRSICQTLEDGQPLTDTRCRLLESMAEQMESVVPDLEQRAAESQQAEQELREREVIEQGQTFAGM